MDERDILWWGHPDAIDIYPMDAEAAKVCSIVTMWMAGLTALVGLVVLVLGLF